MANFGGDSVTPIATSTDTAGAAISFGGGDSDPSAISVTPDGTTAYVVNEANDNVVPINTATNTTGTPISVSGDCRDRDHCRTSPRRPRFR